MKSGKFNYPNVCQYLGSWYQVDKMLGTLKPYLSYVCSELLICSNKVDLSNFPTEKCHFHIKAQY